MKSPSKERRTEIRIPLISETCVWSHEDWQNIPSNLINICKSGVYIQSDKQPEINDKIEVKFPLPGDLGTLSISGQVTWRRWASTKKSKLPVGFGVKFVDVKDNINKILIAYCVYLRNKQIIAISKRIIQEFHGDKPLI